MNYPILTARGQEFLFEIRK